MKDFYEFAKENPILVFFLAFFISGTIINVVSLICEAFKE